MSESGSARWSPWVQADVSENEVFEYLIDDAATRAIVLYLEGVSDGARLLALPPFHVDLFAFARDHALTAEATDRIAERLSLVRFNLARTVVALAPAGWMRLKRGALDTLMRDRTTIVIAHRLSTVRSADLLVVLDRGHIVETGSHAALVARNGLYARLIRRQLGRVVETVAADGKYAFTLIGR